MPGIGELIDGAVQQAPQPSRHGKTSDFIRYYKPRWANSAPTVKVADTGEARMESARQNLNLYVASDAGVAAPLADDVVRPSTGGSVVVPKLFAAIRCAARLFSPIDALKPLRDKQRCIRTSMAATATVIA